MSVTQAIPDAEETFSKLCSDMLTIVRDEELNNTTDDAINQYYGFGSEPRSPWPPLRFRIQVVGRLSRSGYTLRRFMIEVKRRTSDKWVHYGPFSLLQGFVECLEDPSYVRILR